MAGKIAYTSHNEIVEITKQDLTLYPKLSEALQEAEEASSKNLAHPMEMIKLNNFEGKTIVEFLSGKQVDITQRLGYEFVIRYGENLYLISIIFQETQPIIS